MAGETHVDDVIARRISVSVLVLGCALVVMATAMLLLFGWLTYQVVEHPDGVGITRLAQCAAQESDKALYGNAGKNDFVINVSGPSRTVVFMFIGVLMLGVLAGVLRAVIGSGLDMIAFGLGRERRDWQPPSIAVSGRPFSVSVGARAPGDDTAKESEYAGPGPR